ncbi:MAG: helix-turn-helix domain-containing protein [Thermoanaerobaculia bacterium]
MTSASLLRHARRHAGLSQRELGRRAGIPQATFARIEKGKTSPRFETLERLLAVQLRTRPGAAKGRQVWIERRFVRCSRHTGGESPSGGRVRSRRRARVAPKGRLALRRASESSRRRGDGSSPRSTA